MSKKLFNAYYSAKADAIFGHCLYRLTTGEIAQVCALYEVGQPQGYRWDDAVLVGQVQDGGFVRESSERVNSIKFRFIAKDDRIKGTTLENEQNKILQDYLTELDPGYYLGYYNIPVLRENNS